MSICCKEEPHLYDYELYSPIQLEPVVTHTDLEVLYIGMFRTANTQSHEKLVEDKPHRFTFLSCILSLLSWVCVVECHLVSVRTFSVMYDHTFLKLAHYQIRHQATHKVGCQPGHCTRSL